MGSADAAAVAMTTASPSLPKVVVHRPAQFVPAEPIAANEGTRTIDADAGADTPHDTPRDTPRVTPRVTPSTIVDVAPPGTKSSEASGRPRELEPITCEEETPFDVPELHLQLTELDSKGRTIRIPDGSGTTYRRIHVSPSEDEAIAKVIERGSVVRRSTRKTDPRGQPRPKVISFKEESLKHATIIASRLAGKQPATIPSSPPETKSELSDRGVTDKPSRDVDVCLVASDVKMVDKGKIDEDTNEVNHGEIARIEVGNMDKDGENEMIKDESIVLSPASADSKLHSGSKLQSESPLQSDSLLQSESLLKSESLSKSESPRHYNQSPEVTSSPVTSPRVDPSTEEKGSGFKQVDVEEESKLESDIEVEVNVKPPVRRGRVSVSWDNRPWEVIGEDGGEGLVIMLNL